VTRALLDVNVLVALLDSDHADHSRARTWFENEIDQGGASCPITQNGFVRVVSQLRYPSPVPSAEAISRLARATSTKQHKFWCCDVSLLDDRTIDRVCVHGPRQVSGVYLLALAVAHAGRLVSFDRSVPLSAACGAEKRHVHLL
jgi:toxin-antitoxin system PIN domain toxin